MRIEVSCQEPAVCVQILRQLGHTPVVQVLKVGDYCTDKVVIERKEIRDLAASIKDGRLSSQLYRMSRDNRFAWLVIHGDPLDVPGFTRESLWGLVASVTVRYGIQVIWIVSHGALRQALYIIGKICEKVEEGKLGRPWIVPVTVKHCDERVVMLRKAFGIPERVAVNLIKRFGCIRDIMNATEKELMSVDGIGVNRARRIYNLVNYRGEIRGREVQGSN